MKMTLIQETDALLKRCIEGGDVMSMLHAFTLMRLRELTHRTSRAKNQKMRRQVMVRAVALLGREPAQILRAIAADRVMELLASNVFVPNPARRVHVA